jgi:hypothetical protein
MRDGQISVISLGYHGMYLKMRYYILEVGHAVGYWLRNYAANRKVAGSRPVKVNTFFQFT